jgi:peptidyl-tRNA hydrolase
MEEKKDPNEHAFYILINRNVKMSERKYAAQAVHAALMHNRPIPQESGLSGLFRRRRFLDWSLDPAKKIRVLEKSKTLLYRLEALGYPAQRDAGFTELPASTLTAVCLGILTRREFTTLIEETKILFEGTGLREDKTDEKNKLVIKKLHCPACGYEAPKHLFPPAENAGLTGRNCPVCGSKVLTETEDENGG